VPASVAIVIVVTVAILPAIVGVATSHVVVMWLHREGLVLHVMCCVFRNDDAVMAA
jgi:hypothetical protein